MAPEGGERVVLAALAAAGRLDALAGLDHQPRFKQALDDSVQVARVQRHNPIGVRGDRLDEAVSVQVALGEGQKEFKVDRFEGEMVRNRW